GRRAQIHFHEGQSRAGTHTLREYVEKGCRLWSMDQYEAADDGIEPVIVVEMLDRGDSEAGLIQAGRAHSPLGDREGFARYVDAENLALWSDQFGRNRGYIAHAASEIEHTHSGSNPGANEYVAGHVGEKCRLPLQS